MMNYLDLVMPFLPEIIKSLLFIPVAMFDQSEANVASGFRDQGANPELANQLAAEFTRRVNLAKSKGTNVDDNLARGTYNNIWENRDQSSESPSSSAQSTADNTKAAYELLLQYGPELAQLEMTNRQKMMPQELALQQQYGPEFQKLAQSLVSSGRTSDINDVQSLLPALQQIQRDQLTPEEQKLKDLLSGQITAELSMGQALSPEQARMVEQSARTAEGARGISAGRGSANREAVKKALEGRRLQTERQGAATSYLSQQAAERIDPILAVTGRPSTALTTGQQYTNPNATPSAVQTGSQVVGMGNQFAQQDLSQDRYNLSLQLAQNLAGQYGF